MNTSEMNLFFHEDGGYYCLMSADAPMKHPSSGEWIDGVIYAGTDGQLRSTSRERWDTRFTKVLEYTDGDEQVLMMINRCNPGDRDLDFVRVFESWHESEVNLTSEMLTLAVAASMVIMHHRYKGFEFTDLELTMMTSDLQDVAKDYEISKDPVPHGFTFRVRKSFPE